MYRPVGSTATSPSYPSITKVCCWKPTSPMALTLPRSTPSNSPKTLMLAGGGALSAKLSYDIDRSCAEGGGAPAPEAEGLFATAGPGSLLPVSSNCWDAASVPAPAEADTPGSMCESCIPGIRKLDVQPFIDTP